MGPAGETGGGPAAGGGTCGAPVSASQSSTRPSADDDAHCSADDSGKNLRAGKGVARKYQRNVVMVSMCIASHSQAHLFMWAERQYQTTMLCR